MTVPFDLCGFMGVSEICLRDLRKSADQSRNSAQWDTTLSSGTCRGFGKLVEFVAAFTVKFKANACSSSSFRQNP